MILIPTPKKKKDLDGRFRFSKKLSVYMAKSDIAENSVSLLCELFRNYTAKMAEMDFVFDEKYKGFAYISDRAPSETEKNDPENEYALTCKHDGIQLCFAERIGFLHAFVTFLQLIVIEDTDGDGSFYVGCTEISDSPSLPFRGIHICVFHETTLSFLKKCVRLCGIMKYSHIVLEFWGMYRYECAPGFSWNDAYAKEQIKPIIDDANALGIEVVPMLNHLGHASQGRIAFGKHAALDSDLRLAPYFDDDGWCWCTTNPKTEKLLADMRRELCELCGEGKYFHIGCDEAYTFAECDRCRNSGKDKNTLLKEHLIRISNDLVSLGRRPIMWADMLYDRIFDKKIYTDQTAFGFEKIRGELPRDIILADWQYNCTTEEFKTSISLRKDGFDVLACPWSPGKNVDFAALTAKNNGLLGLIETTWHTVHEMEWVVSLSADAEWNGNHPVPFADTNYHLFTAYHARRVCPPCGVYEDSGFIRKETFQE